MFQKRLISIALVALLWATFISTSSAKEDVKQKLSEKQIRSSLNLVEGLLKNSSLVRQVKSANVPQANDLLNQALSYHSLAMKKLSEGNLSEAADARKEIMHHLMLAGRLANKASGYSTKKPAADYENKLKSVQALLDAHKRITEANNGSIKETKLRNAVDPLIALSRKSANEDKYKDAMVSLAKAYLVIADSIKSQRDGQSLVRSLDFATQEEAFDYEISKFEHYKMLVDMLVNERKTIKLDERSKPFFDESNGFHEQGMSLAAKGQHEKAIVFIEKASKSLVNLIRDSGVYIPGI